MKVQEINTPKGKRYVLLDDQFKPIGVVNKYLKFLDNLGKSPNTQRTYAYDLLLYCQFMQKKGISLLDLCNNPERGPIDILSEFVLWLQYPDYSNGILHIDREECARSNKTVNHIMSAVLELYQYLAANGEIQQLEAYRMQMIGGQFKPFLYELVKHKTQVQSSIFKKPVPSVPVKGITREQYNTLFSLCHNRRDKLLIALLYEGGLRINEALGLHFSDIAQIEDKTIRIVSRENNENGARVKNNAEGVIYLPDYVVDLLLDYINEDALEYESDFVFINLYGRNKGFPMKYGSAEKLFERLSNDAGFEVTPHMLRHGFSQEKLESGWTLEQVQAYLRHKNVTSTEIYAQYTDVMKIEKMKEFEGKHDYSKEAQLLGRSH
jgi:integrase/recombinase XerD